MIRAVKKLICLFISLPLIIIFAAYGQDFVFGPGEAPPNSITRFSDANGKQLTGSPLSLSNAGAISNSRGNVTINDTFVLTDGTEGTSGHVLTSTGTGGQASWAAGAATFTGGAITTPLTAPNGSQAAPSITFTNDTDVGMYMVAANNGALVAGNTEMINFSTSRMSCGVPFRQANGAVTAPSYAFVGMDDGGLFRVSASDDLRLAVNGVSKTIWADTKVEVPEQLFINETPSVLVMKSADGTCASCGIDNTDVWSCTSVACP